MKKLLVLAALVLLPSLALCSESPFYLGSEIGYSVSGLKNKKADTFSRFKHQRPDVNIFAGIKATDYLSFELGATPSISGKSSFRAKHGSLSYRGLYASALYCLPITDSLTLMHGIGLSAYNIQLQKAKQFSHRKTKTLPRLSVGASYMINEDLSIRGTVTWNYIRTQFGHLKTHDNFKFGIGLTYRIDML